MVYFINRCNFIDMKELLYKNFHCVCCHNKNGFQTWGYGPNGATKKYVTIDTSKDSIKCYIDRLLGIK